MDDGDDGIVCNGLSHVTLVSGDLAPSVFLLKDSLGSPLEVFRLSLYSQAIEKPPRLF